MKDPISVLTALAHIYTEGHYSIFKYTTNYRVALGTFCHGAEHAPVAEGKTLEDAVDALCAKLRKEAE